MTLLESAKPRQWAESCTEQHIAVLVLCGICSPCKMQNLKISSAQPSFSTLLYYAMLCYTLPSASNTRHYEITLKGNGLKLSNHTSAPLAVPFSESGLQEPLRVSLYSFVVLYISIFQVTKKMIKKNTYCICFLCWMYNCRQQAQSESALVA